MDPGRVQRPGDLVLDPMCGIGTILVEGALVGRRCPGYDCESDWVQITRTNLDAAVRGSDRGFAVVDCLDARASHLALGGLCAHVDLVVLHPPAGREIGAVDLSSWQPEPWWTASPNLQHPHLRPRPHHCCQPQHHHRSIHAAEEHHRLQATQRAIADTESRINRLTTILEERDDPDGSVFQRIQNRLAELEHQLTNTKPNYDNCGPPRPPTAKTRPNSSTTFPP